MSRFTQVSAFATLWAALVGHVSLADEAPSTADAPLAKAGAQESSEARLEEVLTEWLKAARSRRRLDVRFKRYRYDYDFETERRSRGTLAIDDEGRMAYRVEPVAIARGAYSKKQTSRGDEFTLESDAPERWHWTGEETIRVDESSRMFEVIRVGPRSRPPAPSLPLDREGVGSGKSSQVGPLGVIMAVAAGVVMSRIDWSQWQELGRSLAEFVRECPLARPYLMGMPPDELRAKFDIGLVEESETHVRLSFRPKDPARSPLVSDALLILNKINWTPVALKLGEPGGRSETVHIFTEVRIDGRREFDTVWPDAGDLARPNLSGYRRVPN